MRAAQIPLFLWVCAALVAHTVGGGGAAQVAQVVEDRSELRKAARSLRESLRPPDTQFEVLTEGVEPTPAQKVEPPETDPGNDGDNKPDPDAIPDKALKPEPGLKQKDAKVEPPKPEPPKPAPPKPEPPKAPAVEPLPAQVVQVVPPPEASRRLAIKQNVDPNQEDNPSAQRIADDANHTDHETVARNRSHDQDDPHPSLGSHEGPKDDLPGSGDHEDKIAQSEDKKGDATRSPGEARASATDISHQAPRPAEQPRPGPTKAPSVPGADGKGGRATAPAVPAEPPPSQGGAGPASPDVAPGDKGTYTLDPANPGGDGTSRIAGRKRRQMTFNSPVHVDSMGLNGKGAPGGPQLNLSMAGVEAAVGQEKLNAERAGVGASMRSAHRGSWETNKFEKWRAAIENYEPSVTLDNTTSLNAARVPFATYINHIHNQLHPIFAEEQLAWMDGLSASDPMNKGIPVTHLEIVISKDQGKIVRLGVVKSSGVTAFDMVALSSVNRAAPFGKAPDIIVSPDGNVYLHWEFHRDHMEACGTKNAWPYLLKDVPKPKAKAVGPTRKSGGPRSDERPGAPGPLMPLREP